MAINVFGFRPRATAGRCVFLGGALVGALLVAAAPGTASAAACATVGSQVTCTFSYNGTNGSDGTPQNFVVPPGVTSVTIEASGAQGGANHADKINLGGHAKGTLTVTPSETLTVRVGGQPTLTTGGYNGGGNGGGPPGGHFGGGGGGASDVRRGNDTLTNRIIVAGGGGGKGGGNDIGLFLQAGGAGGGTIVGGGAFCLGGAEGCLGAGPTQGGMGGSGGLCPGSTNGADGSLGIGGNAGACGDAFFGGGGGGGLYGGGGGSVAFISTPDLHLGGGGGGGSGFVLPSASGQTNEVGVRSGNGAVTITYTAPTLPGNIFATTFKNCTTLHVGYNRFVNGTIVHWRVTTNGVGTVASGQFPAIGGGKLGSKTYHFIDIPLGTTLPAEASGIQSHVLFTWANGGRFYATRDPGC